MAANKENNKHIAIVLDTDIARPKLDDVDVDFTNIKLSSNVHKLLNLINQEGVQGNVVLLMSDLVWK